MQKDIHIVLSPREASDEAFYMPVIARKLGINPKRIGYIQLTKRSIDARRSQVKINLHVRVFIDEHTPDDLHPRFDYPDVSKKPEVVIVGAGPAGLFAALRLIELGLKPVILERGKDVTERKRDIALLHRGHEVDADSNYSFGEGGAGTFSDGKLYTRSKKRGNVRKILDVFHFHGASEDILIDTHPHIGTDKLPRIIGNVRETILNAGGRIHFNTRVSSFSIRDGQLEAVQTHSGDKIETRHLILAVGHSARDLFFWLNENGYQLEKKPFAMGVRVEHPQSLIDSIQYSCQVRSQYLPSASYSLVKQIEDRGVYSFCMCPGGFIVPAATAPGEMVVNGMSPSHRNSKFANSGMVVEIREEDLAEFQQYGVMAGVKFQQAYEQLAYQHGNEQRYAPAQRLTDFVAGNLSTNLPETSFNPGVVSSDLHSWLPPEISRRLQNGFKEFEKQKPGYLTSEALVLGVESRTSSPIKIPRLPDTFEHPQIKGFFPCGEGSGYAGGIVSSAVDGELCAEKVAELMGVKI